MRPICTRKAALHTDSYMGGGTNASPRPATDTVIVQGALRMTQRKAFPQQNVWCFGA